MAIRFTSSTACGGTAAGRFARQPIRQQPSNVTLIGWIVGTRTHAQTRSDTAPGTPGNTPASVAAASGANLRRTVTVEVAEKTKDAVVYISTTKVINQRISPGGDPFWQQFDLGYR